MHESMKQKLVNEKFLHVLKNIFYVVFEHGKKSIETKVNNVKTLLSLNFSTSRLRDFLINRVVHF